MRTVLRASLRTHTRRYVSAAVAVVIGVAFVVVTSLLSDATRAGLVAGVELPYRGADVVVSDVDADQAERVVDRAEADGDSAAVLGWTPQSVRVGDALLGERTDVGAIATDPDLRWQVLRDGRFPEQPGEVVADANSVKGEEVAIGDIVEVGTGRDAVEATLVGLVDTPSASVGAQLYLTWPDLRGLDSDLWVDSVVYAGPGASALAEALPEGARVQPRDEFVEDRQAELTNEVNVLAILLLIFAAIALFVSVLVIANTFSILFAQRARDFALLRCVGGTRRQVLRSVRVEALALGLVSALLGLGVGTGLGYALVALAKSALPTGTMAFPVPSLPWYAGALATGVLVTVVAAWLPTRRVVRISPLAALRPDDSTGVRSGAGRLRVLLGVVAIALGGALLALSVGAGSAAVMVAGGAASFTGVLLLGPVLVPALIRAVGGAVGRVAGAPARLAAENAVRNPRRTAATTASLLVGVTLTTAVLVGLASSRSAVADDLDTDHPVDVTLTGTDRALSADLVDEVGAAPGVDSTVALTGTSATVSGVGRLPVVAMTDDADVVRGPQRMPEPGEVWVPVDLMDGLADGSEVTVRAGAHSQVLRVRTGDGFGEAALVAPATLTALTSTTEPWAIWVRASDDADAEDLGGDLDALARPAGADLVNGLRDRAWVTLQLDVLTGTVVALLGIAVVIALIGIGNTLGLSVLERGRENALLRALGLTRRQLRATLATEAVLLSVVATALGTAIGVTFAWVAVQALVSRAVDDAAMVLPWGQLALVVLVAGIAGLVSALLPARRAARVAPAAGLSLD
ncbi:ABC transporter permease [Nocardioides sp. YIM 152315]|uniref:ABC transporter permease n=1 Tax=Nocardioides sp. YIM 152315 TaxID=3031760 RepID=UPI0023DCD785|nr:ABC transporter permease [Nocardioides sp. YIM 152315]MDF1603589.1 ABC transporter permease [Nocardioides sp. YIM 152315]